MGELEETDADIRELVIEEDDTPISVADIKGELHWMVRQAADKKAREEREAARVAGTPIAEISADTDDGGHNIEEMPEEKSLRLKEQADREEAWKKRTEEREAKEAATLAEFKAVTYKLPTDWPEDIDREGGASFCRDGCKFRRLLSYASPIKFHVCLNPNSPRAGLLTQEEQGGRDCFVVG